MAALADDLPVDDNTADVAGVLERVAVEHDDVGILAGLERSDLLLNADPLVASMKKDRRGTRIRRSLERYWWPARPQERVPVM